MLLADIEFAIDVIDSLRSLTDLNISLYYELIRFYWTFNMNYELITPKNIIFIYIFYNL